MNAASDLITLFQSVVDDPDNDEARLAYADAMQARGDTARAEFIRIQCALAQNCCSADDKHPLQTRQNALLGEHELEWLGPLRALLADWSFRRGFLERVVVAAQTFRAEAERIFALCPATSLELIEPAGHLPAISQMPLLARVRRLTMRHSQLQADDLRYLASSPYVALLRELDLSVNPIADAGAIALATSPHLSGLICLNLDWCAIGEAGIRAIASSPFLSGLTHLSIPGAQGNLKSLSAVTNSPYLTRLECLDISSMFNNHDLDSEEGANQRAQLLASSPNLASLRTLVANDLGLNDGNVSTLASSPHFGRLEKLALSENVFGDAGLAALVESSHLPSLYWLDLHLNHVRKAIWPPAAVPVLFRLKTLDLGINTVSAGFIQTLAISPSAASLQTLTLWGDFGHGAAVALASSRQLQSLKEIQLHGRLGDSGAAALAGWPGMARLNRLDLCQNGIGDEGAEALAACPHLAQLSELNLSYNEVGCRGLNALVSSPHLRSLRKLELSNNPLGKESAKQLAKASLPGLSHLDVSGCQFEAYGVRALAFASGLAGLRSLTLAWSDVTEAGPGVFENAPAWHRLRELHLQLEHHISKEELYNFAAAIGRCSKLPRLRRFILHSGSNLFSFAATSAYGPVLFQQP